MYMYVVIVSVHIRNTSVLLMNTHNIFFLEEKEALSA